MPDKAYKLKEGIVLIPAGDGDHCRVADQNGDFIGTLSPEGAGFMRFFDYVDEVEYDYNILRSSEAKTHEFKEIDADVFLTYRIRSFSEIVCKSRGVTVSDIGAWIRELQEIEQEIITQQRIKELQEIQQEIVTQERIKELQEIEEDIITQERACKTESSDLQQKGSFATFFRQTKDIADDA